MISVTLLLPTLSRCSSDPTLATGTLAKWFARGDRLTDAAPGRNVALRELFVWPGKTLPVAALTREMDAGDAGPNIWLRADLAYVRADNLAARMMACGDLDLRAEDREELANSLRPLLGDAGFPLETSHSTRWYLRCPAGAQLPEFAAPEDVLGDDLQAHLPSGPAGMRWRSLLNEVQIHLHNHPINIARFARGQLPANSLWFWGAGKLPDWIKSELTRAASDDELVQALARRAGVAVTALALEAALAGKKETPQSVLLDLTGGARQPELEAQWLGALDKVLRGGKVSELRVLLLSGERLVIRASNRWRFWRRIKPLRAAR